MYWQTQFRAATAPSPDSPRCTGADAEDDDARCRGVVLDGKRYPVGDAAWPELPTKKHGGNGSMFIVPARKLATVAAPARHGQVAIKELPGRPYTTTGDRLPTGWLQPVVLTLDDTHEQGPYYLRVRSTGAAILNNESAAASATPWVTVYNDPVPGGTDTPITLSQPARPVLTGPAGRAPMVAYVVFDREPPAGTVSYQLDAAPDGVEDYAGSTGIGDTEPIYLAAAGADPKQAVMRPSETWLSSSSEFALQKMTWSRWGPDRAEGTGNAYVNLCDPTCAESTGRVTYPVDVVLSDPETRCGKKFFTTFRMAAKGEPPPGAPGNTDLDIAPFC
ncbi:hypothetical protein [Actinoplanes sp. L3-i22]|uniref:hypothetical protein n=1 Tax=Actinoplanes sp. L3-i22 TaxID=2836373 RepID=UPI001C75537D|nr:hypothetical protein [Actinoplanes sp. L3-i22]BCY13456.1 hypothetical protein L3i22_085440 [Actinoplanes sp. L3-i22]